MTYKSLLLRLFLRKQSLGQGDGGVSALGGVGRVVLGQDLHDGPLVHPPDLLPAAGFKVGLLL